MPDPTLSQAELLDGLFSALQTILTIVSLFFAIVSGYIAALYFFLAHAGLFLRALAFALLTIGMSFLGGTAAVVGSMQEGLLQAWGRLPEPVIAVDRLRNPMPVATGCRLIATLPGVIGGRMWSAAACRPARVSAATTRTAPGIPIDFRGISVASLMVRGRASPHPSRPVYRA